MKPARAQPWTTTSELVEVLRRRWGTGGYLRAYARGETWQPVGLPVRSPAAGELLEHLDEVGRWLDAFRRGCRGRGGRDLLRIELKVVSGPRVGRNELPRRVWVDTFDDLVSLLGVADEVRGVDRLLAGAEAEPEVRSWVMAHPHRALALAGVWTRLLATVGWIRDHETPDLYLRQIDVEGVDTKFVETYRLELSELLERVLPPSRIDSRFGRRDFTRRFRFRARPDYTRVRFLAPQSVFPPAISEVSLRSSEFADLDPGCSTVIMVENEITYLALPPLPDALAIFGSGFALGSVAGFVWLQDKRILYWGDVDTYGFLILNRLRARYPQVESVMMDHPTLLAHRSHWGVEEEPTSLALPHLTHAEGELYRDLVEDTYGHHVRLEQERVRFSVVRAELARVVRLLTLAE